VINTSSSGNRLGRVDVEDLDGEVHYSAVKAYNAAKLAQILFTKELHRRHVPKGLTSVAFNPGNINTGFATQPGSANGWVHLPIVEQLLLSPPDKGADTFVYLNT
jgi:NAD(P)-dependent dehydrogenase (short-subunit alcohol dehydrogenase family)